MILFASVEQNLRKKKLVREFEFSNKFKFKMMVRLLAPSC